MERFRAPDFQPIADGWHFNINQQNKHALNMLEIEKYDAAALYQLSQDCDQWKTEREKRVTASDAAKL